MSITYLPLFACVYPLSRLKGKLPHKQLSLYTLIRLPGSLQILIKFLASFMVLFTVSGALVAAFQCNPPKYVYDFTYVMSSDRPQHCLTGNTAYAVFIYQAVVLFTIDVIILLYPIPALWGLKMGKGKGLVFVLILGSGMYRTSHFPFFLF